MTKKRIKVTFEITVDEDTYEEYAKGKNFKEFEKEIKAQFDDDVVEDIDIKFEEVKD